MLCVTKEGTNVNIKVTDFTPYFWIELPSQWKTSWTTTFVDDLREHLSLSRRGEFLFHKSHQIHQKYKFRDYQWNRKRNFMPIVCVSEDALKQVYYVLKKYTFANPTNTIRELTNYKFSIYEKNVTPVLRFIHRTKLKPSGWIRLGNGAEKSTGKLLRNPPIQ